MGELYVCIFGRGLWVKLLDLTGLHQIAMLHRRGYDVVEFAKQGAISVKGMELVPEAVSEVMICFSIQLTA